MFVIIVSEFAVSSPMQERRGFLAFYTPKLNKLISEGKKDEAAENRRVGMALSKYGEL